MTRTEARDEMIKVLADVVKAWTTANHATCPIVFDDTDKDAPAKGAWMRQTIKHNEPGKNTLGPVGRRRFEQLGVMIVQVFTPYGDGFTLSDALTTVLEDAFHGYSGSIRFSRIASKEIGKSGPWAQVNFQAWFAYDERG